MNGLMAESMRENGRTIKWKAMVFSHGLMAEDMRENTQMIKKKARVYFSGKSMNKLISIQA